MLPEQCWEQTENSEDKTRANTKISEETNPEMPNAVSVQKSSCITDHWASPGIHKNPGREWIFCLLGWEMYQIKTWPKKLSGKEQWLPFLAEMLRKGRGKMLHLWKTKCCLARLTTMVLNKMPGFWSCFVFFDTRAVSPKQNTNHYREFITWPLHVVLSTVLVSSSILPSQRMHCLGILPSESFFSMI